MRLSTLFLALPLIACPAEVPDNMATGPGGGPSGTGNPTPSGAPPLVPTEVNMAQFNLGEGEGVTLTGTLSYGGEQEGKLLLQILTIREDGPFLEHSQDLEETGPFSLEVPKMLGEARMVVFLDSAGDGASASDPAGMRTITVGLSALQGVDIEIVDDADLGDLAPGGHGEMSAPPPATDGQVARDRAFLEGQEGVQPEGEDEVTSEPPPEMPELVPPPEGPPPEGEPIDPPMD